MDWNKSYNQDHYLKPEAWRKKYLALYNYKIVEIHIIWKYFLTKKNIEVWR
jgi:hypothetical protein